MSVHGKEFWRLLGPLIGIYVRFFGSRISRSARLKTLERRTLSPTPRAVVANDIHLAWPTKRLRRGHHASSTTLESILLQLQAASPNRRSRSYTSTGLHTSTSKRNQERTSKDTGNAPLEMGSNAEQPESWVLEEALAFEPGRANRLLGNRSSPPKHVSHTTSSARKDGAGTGTIEYLILADVLSTTFNTGTSLFGRRTARDDGHIESWRVSITKCEVVFICGDVLRDMRCVSMTISRAEEAGRPVSAISLTYWKEYFKSVVDGTIASPS